MNDTVQTPEQLADAQRRDVMAYAYHDKNGKYYTINEKGERVETTLDATLPDGTRVQALSPEYQKVADQTASLMMTYSKMLALNEADRGIIAKLFKSGGGAVDGLSDAGKKFYEEAKKTAGVDFSLPGSGIIDTAGNVVDAAKAPFSIMSDILTAGKNVLAQWGGGEVNADNALAIGTAYASARQAVAAGRPAEPGIGDYFKGVFSKNFGSYLGAGFAWLLDKVTGLAEHIPGIGDWIKKQGWHSDLTLGQHIEKSMRDVDNAHVEHEMGKLAEIGDVKTADLSILTRGGTITKTDGTQTNVLAAGSDNKAPTTSDGKTQETVEQAAQANANGPKKNALERSVEAVKNSSFKSIAVAAEHPVLTAAVTVPMAVGTVRGVKGAAQGFVKGTAEQMVGENSALNKSAAEFEKKAAQKSAQAVEAAAGKAPKTLMGKTIPFTGKEANAELALKLEREAKELGEKAVKKMAQAAEREAMIGGAKPLLHGGKTLVEVANESHVAAKGGNWLMRSTNWMENSANWVGRGFGKMLGKGGNAALNAGDKVMSSSAAKVVTEAGERYVSKVGLEVAGKTLGKAIPVAGEVVMASDDIVDSYHAAQKGDKKQAVRSGARAAGGVAGGLAGAAVGAEGGAMVGAAVGVWFGGVGAAPGAAIGGFIGGIAGSIGGFYGARWATGKAVDAATEKKEAAPAHTVKVVVKHVEPAHAAAPKVDMGLHTAAVDTTLNAMRAQNAQLAAANHGKTLIINGATTVGAVMNHGGAAPTNLANKSNGVSSNHLA